MMTGIKFAEHLRDPIRAKGKKESWPVTVEVSSV